MILRPSALARAGALALALSVSSGAATAQELPRDHHLRVFMPKRVVRQPAPAAGGVLVGRFRRDLPERHVVWGVGADLNDEERARFQKVVDRFIARERAKKRGDRVQAVPVPDGFNAFPIQQQVAPNGAINVRVLPNALPRAQQPFKVIPQVPARPLQNPRVAKALAQEGWKRVDTDIQAVSATVEALDDSPNAKRNARAMGKLLSAVQMVVDDVRRVLGDEAADAAFVALNAERNARVNARLEDFTDLEKVWAYGLRLSLTRGDIWKEKVHSTWTDDQKEIWSVHEARRVDQNFEASVELATVLLATELRLRAPEVTKLRRSIEAWIEDREPTNSEISNGDLVDEVLARGKVRGLLLPVQSVTLTRMRTAKKPVAPAADAPGDDLALGRGRYPEDDFVLEAAALCLFHGWDWDEVPELTRGAAMLGREARRSGSRPMRFGDSSLFKTLTQPNDSEMWKALVARRRAKSGASDEDPGPKYSDKPTALINARVELIISHLDGRLRLGEDQVQPLREILRTFVTREHAARAKAFGALDPPAVWRELRFVEGKDPRRGSSSRRRMCAALDEVLTDAQRFELGLVKKD